MGKGGEITCFPLENDINTGLYYVSIFDGVSRKVLPLAVTK